MSNIKENRVSSSQEFRAPDNAIFKFCDWVGYGGVPREALFSREHFLAKMRQIIAKREPANLHYLDTPSTSFEHAMSKVLMESKELDVKADITRMLVEKHLIEGHRDRAVETLAYANAAELSLREYDNEWVMRQCDMAGSEGDLRGLFDAWSIAKHMINEGDKIINLGLQPGEVYVPSQEWIQKEDETLNRYGTKLLEQEMKLHDDTYATRLRYLFNTMQFRENGGYNSKQPSDLAIKIADRIIELDLATEDEDMIVWDAMDAGKSMEEGLELLYRLIKKQPTEELTVEQSEDGLAELLRRMSEDESNA